LEKKNPKYVEIVYRSSGKLRRGNSLQYLSVLGLTISERKNVAKKFEMVGMDLKSVGILGFSSLIFPQNTLGILIPRSRRKSEFRNRKRFQNSVSFGYAKKKLEFHVPNQIKGFGIPFRAEMRRRRAGQGDRRKEGRVVG